MGASYPQPYDWQESTPSTLNATVTHAAQTGIIHIMDFLNIQGDSAGKTYTVTTGSRILFIGDLGDETLTLGVAYIGDIGKDIAVAINTTGQILMTGHSQKVN